MDREDNKKILPKNWIDCKLKDIGEIIAGGTPSTNEPSYWGDEISWITPADLSGYKSMFISKGRKSISKKGLQNSSARLIPRGSILFSSRAPIGYVVIASNELATNQGFKNIVPYSGINSKFLYYYLIANKQLAEENASGTTFKEISASKFAELPLTLAPSTEQNRIVQKLDELLSDLEKGKQQLQIALEQLKVYRQSVLKSAFEGKLSEEWRSKQRKLKTPDELVREINAYRKQQYENQLKEFEAGKIKVKPKEPIDVVPASKAELEGLTRLPLGWAWLRFADILTLEYGKALTKSTREVGKYNVYGSSGIVGTNKEALIKQPAVIVGRKGNVGSVYFAEQPFWPIDTVYYALIPDFLNGKYIFHLLSNFQLGKLDKSTTIPGLNRNDAYTRFVPLCCLEEQNYIDNAIENHFSVLENTLKDIQYQLGKSYSLKQSLLQKAFEGKLVEQDSTDEPASALLERIRNEREEYLKSEKERKKAEKPLYIKSRKMAEELKQIMEILKEIKEPISAKTLWRSSVHKNDIDNFYAELKKHIESGEIKETRKGKESLLEIVTKK